MNDGGRCWSSCVVDIAEAFCRLILFCAAECAWMTFEIPSAWGARVHPSCVLPGYAHPNICACPAVERRSVPDPSWSSGMRLLKAQSPRAQDLAARGRSPLLDEGEEEGAISNF